MLVSHHPAEFSQDTHCYQQFSCLLCVSLECECHKYRSPDVFPSVSIARAQKVLGTQLLSDECHLSLKYLFRNFIHFR